MLVSSRVFSLRIALASLSVALALPARAVVCNVPSASHPTVGAALRDFSCTTVQLAAGVFPESVLVERDVAIQGAGAGVTSLAGSFTASGATADVTLAALTVDGTAAGVAGCWPQALWATGGAEVATGPDVVVLQTTAAGGPCRIFVDGFESGGVLAWSAHAP